MSPLPVVVRAITWLPVGGIERRLVTVVPKLRDRGWDVRVVCLREEGPLAPELRERGIPVDVIPFPSRLSPRALLTLRGYLRRCGARVLHSHMYRSNVPATIAGRLAGTPVIFSQIHNVDSWDTPRQAALDRLLTRWRTGTISVSAAVQRDVMNRLAIPAEKAPVLYNGIDLDLFRPDAERRRALREQWGVPPDRPLLLVPARLHPQKNPFGVLDAFRQLLASALGPAPILVYVGGGKLEEPLRAAAEDLKGQVLVVGQRDDMPAVYNAADAIVLSSLKEGFSNAVVEALACGKPVIASDVGGNAEAVNSPAVGWIHPPGSPEALTAQLLEACRSGADALRAMEADCIARARHFSVDALVEATHQLYRRALRLEP